MNEPYTDAEGGEGILYYSDEKERGSLEIGKVADMVILSDNPYEVNPENLKDIKAEQLILSGKPYESAVTPLGRCIWRGLFSKNRY